ncbi:MAG TPA: ribosome recycling factor [bacterium]|jgi:ribosome recycling factor|nr:ribosome recycling factor [bacterium]HNT66924.1 ribosome recycling factor [bacterium]HOX85965.1 ribosome recycling factor [bacterium]HPG45052.1 ribosome recycling factor [bacterium]HPM97294.1 ribosome recycling factor [bacterium]
MIDELERDVKRRMDSAIDNIRSELAKFRTGKASPALLDSISVNYYGNMTPIRQVANVSAPEPRLLVVQPWDRSLLGEIEKAILKADLGLNPTNDGILIRVPIPQLTEERRRDLVKLAKKIAEDAKVAVRNIRRDANERLKKAEKSSEISEDQLHTEQERVQKLTDEAVKKIDEILELKEKDIMEI